MKKHLDWKRIGWTAVPVLAVIFTLIFRYLIPESQWYTNKGELVTNKWPWAVGMGLFISLFITFLVYVFENLFIAIIRFYYHNGEEEK